nr:unnamed protein product [Callosobruchus analis]
MLNVVVFETEELLEAELSRPKKVWVRKWIDRRSIHGTSYQPFKELAAEDTTEYYFAPRLIEEPFNILLSLAAPVTQKCDTYM